MAGGSPKIVGAQKELTGLTLQKLNPDWFAKKKLLQTAPHSWKILKYKKKFLPIFSVMYIDLFIQTKIFCPRETILV